MRDRHRMTWLGWIGIALLLGVVAGFSVIRHDAARRRFPYGVRPHALLSLSIALTVYSDKYDGWFPTGGRTPEESLQLLGDADGKFDAALLMAGKSGDIDAVRQSVADELPMTTDICGWNYVPGLRAHEQSDLAVVWDRMEGLGPAGERLPDGGREVLYVTGKREFVESSEWGRFLEKQQALHDVIRLKQRSTSRSMARD